MVDQLLLDLEGFATFFTLVPVAKVGKGKEKKKQKTAISLSVHFKSKMTLCRYF